MKRELRDVMRVLGDWTGFTSRGNEKFSLSDANQGADFPA